MCGSGEELSGECCSGLLEGPAFLRLHELPVRRSGLAEASELPWEAQQGPDGLSGGLHVQGAQVMVGEGQGGAHVALEGRRGQRLG